MDKNSVAFFEQIGAETSHLRCNDIRLPSKDGLFGFDPTMVAFAFRRYRKFTLMEMNFHRLRLGKNLYFWFAWRRGCFLCYCNSASWRRGYFACFLNSTSLRGGFVRLFENLLKKIHVRLTGFLDCHRTCAFVWLFYLGFRFSYATAQAVPPCFRLHSNTWHFFVRQIAVSPFIFFTKLVFLPCSLIKAYYADVKKYIKFSINSIFSIVCA